MEDLVKNDDQCLESIAQGSEQAFERLFYAYKNKVYSMALLFTKNKVDAEDVVQDVFSRIWKYRRKLPEIKQFSTWIVTVTRHSALTFIKKMAMEQTKIDALQRFQQDCSPMDAENVVRKKELQSLMQSALLDLTPQQRKIFELSRLQGLDRKVVATSLGLSPATVSVHLTIALRRVRSFLYQHHYETILLALLLPILKKI